ncbi:MAG: glutamate--tRNA ligase [Actinobacteria bacterium]|nr:glutamate--tRNA ligase [Actinomycetota bacterium]
MSLESRVRVRFAPSPTGTLHIGSARTALFNFLFARHAGGDFVLRVDDTDAVRSQDRHEDAILADLRWLGLEWDEGPDVGGPCAPYRQSERLGGYRAAADQLLAGGLAYHCFCPEERLAGLRAAVLAEGRPSRYDGRCFGLAPDEVQRRLAAGEPAALRFHIPHGDIVIDDLIRGPVVVGADAVGDFIIVRSDGVAGYNFATVVDDRDMGITHVIRGDDHLTNTARQVLLFRALGAPVPGFAHHSMVLGADGGKLSKRHGATAVGDYRELGYLPQAVVNYLALLSWSHGEDEVLGMDRLIADFEIDKLSASAVVFDQAKLDWLDHEHIMGLAPEVHERLFAARLPAGTPPPAAAALAAAFRPSLVAYGQAARAATVLEPPAPPAGLTAALSAAGVQLTWFRALRGTSPQWLSPGGAKDLIAAYRAWGKERGVGARDLLMPLRIALTGAEHGPELPLVLAALERGETLRRLDDALAGGFAGEPTTTSGDTP